MENCCSVQVFNIGEYWVDMEWNGCELNRNQDAARQVSCCAGMHNGSTWSHPVAQRPELELLLLRRFNTAAAPV